MDRAASREGQEAAAHRGRQLDASRDAALRDAALELLVPVFETLAIGFLNHANADPDLDTLRDDPRYKAMVANAKARLAAGDDGGSSAES